MKKIIFILLLSGLLMFGGTVTASTWATIDPVEDVILGDNVTFSGDTNVRVGQDVFVRVYSPESIQESGEPTLLRTPATEGNGSHNRWSVTVPTGNIYVGEFLVTAENTLPANGTHFNISVESEDWWTKIDPIPDYPAGSAFNISGTTNIREGYRLFFDLTPSWLYDDTSFCAAPINAQWNWSIIEKGENGINTWRVPVNTIYSEERRAVLDQEYYYPGSYTVSIINFYSVNIPPERAVFNLTDPVIEPATPKETHAPGFVFITSILAATAALLFSRKQ